MDELLVSKDSGSLNRDESRRTVTFNYARVIRYLVLVEDVSRMFDKLFREKDVVSISKGRRAMKIVSMIRSRRGGLSLESL